MANQEQLDLIKQGTDAWNTWRIQHPEIQPDLIRADLEWANLSGANLSRADLSDAELDHANLSKANLSKANLGYAYIIATDLSYADLSGAKLYNATLTGADLSYTNLSDADLSYTDLSYTSLDNANLSSADLTGTRLVDTNLTNARLTDCQIYGISAWDVQLDGAEQFDLTITPEDQPRITLDNLKVAQFIYLLLNNEEIRDAVDTIAKKAVLILGRFTPDRKAVLDALREALREQNYLPILFDFENPKNRDVTETVRTLAHLVRFILADLTDPNSIPLELDAIVPFLEVPLQPLLLETNRAFSMFVSFTKYDWVLPIHKYKDLPSLLASLENLLADAEKKVDELALKKARRLIRQ